MHKVGICSGLGGPGSLRLARSVARTDRWKDAPREGGKLGPPSRPRLLMSVRRIMEGRGEDISEISHSLSAEETSSVKKQEKEKEKKAQCES